MCKRILLILAVFWLLPAFACCEGTAAILEEGLDEPMMEMQYNTYELARNADKVKRLGRSSVTENGVTCDFTASGIEFEACLSGPLSFELVHISADVYFTVSVDGEPLEERFLAKAGEKAVLTTEDLGDEALRTIRIAKQTEFSCGYCELASISFCGQLAGPAENSEYYIEFIGDSLTSGYGNLIHGMPEDGSNPGRAIFADGLQSYAAIACDTIGADYSVISYSGMGLQKGWVEVLAKDFYQADAYCRDHGAKPFDFSQARRPDVVVVNLGTNDLIFLNRGEGSRSAFEAGVYELVRIIRNGYGEDTPILWIYGMNGFACSDITQSVFETLGGEEAGLWLLEFPNDSNGGNGHPSLDAHSICAEILTFKLYEMLDESA